VRKAKQVSSDDDEVGVWVGVGGCEMIVRPTSVEGFYYDSDSIEFTLEAIDRTENPKCRVTINTDEFTLAEWQAFSRAVEAGFALMREEA
jgi:hypothetical protein